MYSREKIEILLGVRIRPKRFLLHLWGKRYPVAISQFYSTSNSSFVPNFRHTAAAPSALIYCGTRGHHVEL